MTKRENAKRKAQAMRNKAAVKCSQKIKKIDNKYYSELDKVQKKYKKKSKKRN